MHCDCYCSSKKYSIIHVSNNAINIFNSEDPLNRFLCLSLIWCFLIISPLIIYHILEQPWYSWAFLDEEEKCWGWSGGGLLCPAQPVHYRYLIQYLPPNPYITGRYLPQYPPPNRFITGTYFNICRPTYAFHVPTSISAAQPTQYTTYLNFSDLPLY